MNSETVVGFNESSEKKPVYFDLNTMPWETLTDEHVGATFKDLKMVLDERTCDGHYYASSLKYMKDIFKHPEVLDNPPETVVEDIE